MKKNELESLIREIIKDELRKVLPKVVDSIVESIVKDTVSKPKTPVKPVMAETQKAKPVVNAKAAINSGKGALDFIKSTTQPFSREQRAHAPVSMMDDGQPSALGLAPMNEGIDIKALSKAIPGLDFGRMKEVLEASKNANSNSNLVSMEDDET